MNQHELSRLKKNLDGAITTLNARIDNITIDSILDRHIGGFESKVNLCSEKIKALREESNTLRREKAELDGLKEKNKELQTQIDSIKAKMMSVDVKNIADTQRYIESLKQDTVYISKDRYSNIVESIASTEDKIIELEKEMSVHQDKLNRFTKAKQVLGLSD